MDKEDFYELLLAFAKSVNNDADQDCFDWHVDHLKIDDSKKKLFVEMVQNF